jgi:hypothetical protein
MPVKALVLFTPLKMWVALSLSRGFQAIGCTPDYLLGTYFPVVRL